MADTTVYFPGPGSGGATVPIKAVDNLDGTFGLSISSALTLDPTNLATSAKQPSLGTAGTASANVITVQGIAGGTAMVTDVAVLALQPTRFTNAGANATLNVKATAGSVLACVCINTNAAVRYLQLHNTATFPADQGVPVYSFPVPPGGYGIGIGTDFFTNAGVAFATGIAFAFSTTPNTYTAGTAGEQTTMIHYR